MPPTACADRIDARLVAKRRRIRPLPLPAGTIAEVTVVIPAYNYARYLEECVLSALRQRDVNVRVVIADDCSTDETPALIERLVAQHPQVAAFRNERNQGHIPTVNRAVARVESPYLVKLDADDLLAPGSLARSVALLEAHPEVSFVYGRPRHFTGDAPSVRDGAARSWTLWPGRRWLEDRCAGAVNVISQPEVVIRTERLAEVGGVPEDLPHTSDLYVWLRLAGGGMVGRVNGPVQGLYRVHAASMQRTVNAGLVNDLRGRLAAFDCALSAPEIGGDDRLSATVHRTLAASALDRACRAYDRGRTGEVPVALLVELATEIWPDALDLPQGRALVRREAVGPDKASHHPRFIARALVRRGREQLGHQRWLRTGER